MSNTKHTPGPWTVYAQPQEWPGIDSDTMSIIIFGEEGDLERGIKGESFTEAMANARLIAASPDLLAVAGEENARLIVRAVNTHYDLLAACEEVAAWIDEPGKGRALLYPHLADVILPKLKAAIAAAKGEK